MTILTILISILFGFIIFYILFYKSNLTNLKKNVKEQFNKINKTNEKIHRFFPPDIVKYNVSRIIAIGDIHGDCKKIIQISQFQFRTPQENQDPMK